MVVMPWFLLFELLHFAVVMVLLGLGGPGVVPGGIEAIRKSSHVWGDMKRKGFDA